MTSVPDFLIDLEPVSPYLLIWPIKLEMAYKDRVSDLTEKGKWMRL